MLDIALTLLLIAPDLPEFAKLPPDDVCHAKYCEALEWERKCWAAAAKDDDAANLAGWEKAFADFARCRDFWYAAWCVSCSADKYPEWTWEQRQQHLARCQEIIGEQWDTLPPWRPPNAQKAQPAQR